MKKFSYISGKKLTVGGVVITPDGLSRLDARSLQTAIKNKTIKEDVTRKTKDKKGADSIRKDSEESTD